MRLQPSIQRIIWLDDAPIALVSATHQLTYVEADHLGTPRAVIDPASNSVVWRWLLAGAVFGEASPESDPDQDGIALEFNLRYPGQYYDAETGLHYNYHRDYEPGTGRYVESDPVGLKGGIATYRYAYANPTRYLDPSGLLACSTLATWRGMSWAGDTQTHSMGDPTWELRDAHGQMAAGGPGWVGRIGSLNCLMGGCPMANCFAVYIQSYEEITANYAKRFTLEYCVDEQCLGPQQFVRLRTETESLADTRSEFKVVLDTATTTIDIPALTWARAECLKWVGSLH